MCISLTIGLLLVLTAQKTYQASTLILVQQQSVPTAYVRSVVTSSINQRINTISQQILSRSNLEKIIEQFNLYADRSDLYLEEKIANMRKRVQVKIERARHGAEAFSIQFTGSEPQKVMRITNTLASFFMDENLKVREAQAIGTSEFLYSELEKTRRRLEEHELKLSAFRSKYLGGLPDELESNLRTLDRLQQQLADKNTELREAKNALALVASQIATVKQQQNIGTRSSTQASQFAPPFGMTESEEQLFLAEQEYNELLSRYTDRHPDIQRIKKRIEKLTRAVEVERGLSANEEAKASVSKPRATINPALMQLQANEALIKNDIEKIGYNIRDIEGKMKVYQRRVEDTPKRELELQSLKRDYANIRDIYNSLLDRKLEAELSVNMEKKQKGEQFRIIDYARLPEKPISPNVEKFFFLAVFLGLGLAVGFIFLLEFFDPFIRRDEQLEDELDLTILATIPLLKDSVKERKEYLTVVAFVGCSVYVAILLASFGTLSLRGLDRTINLIKTYFNF
ncbi:MAG: protein GumC [Desulfobacterales bacterium]|nr:protein GumC [Desulfobacterales bacterium]